LYRGRGSPGRVHRRSVGTSNIGFTAENAETAEMTEKERLDQITGDIIVNVLVNGIRRAVNNFPDSLRSLRSVPPSLWRGRVLCGKKG
jgi:hypothetical protein